MPGCQMQHPLVTVTEANEFYFHGHSKSQAPWRFHEENNLREYELRVRKTKAREFSY